MERTRGGRSTQRVRRPQSVRITELNPHLMCALCGGYYVDATTIIECLHSFCKTCIVRYLESSKYCPICDVQVHKTKPLINIRPDHTLQELVYKLVPGLYTREVLKRRQFYRQHAADTRPSGSTTEGETSDTTESDQSRGPVVDNSPVGPDTMSISLELSTSGSPITASRGKKSHSHADTAMARRYLMCPAMFTIGHLKKFVRMKLEISPELQVDVFHIDEPLSDSYALMDIAYLYSWFKTAPLPLYFSVFERPQKRLKLEVEVSDQVPEPTDTAMINSPEPATDQGCSQDRKETKHKASKKVTTKRKSQGSDDLDVGETQHKVAKCSTSDDSEKSARTQKENNSRTQKDSSRSFKGDGSHRASHSGSTNNLTKQSSSHKKDTGYSKHKDNIKSNDKRARRLSYTSMDDNPEAKDRPKSVSGTKGNQESSDKSPTKEKNSRTSKRSFSEELAASDKALLHRSSRSPSKEPSGHKSSHSKVKNIDRTSKTENTKKTVREKSMDSDTDDDSFDFVFKKIHTKKDKKYTDKNKSWTVKKTSDSSLKVTSPCLVPDRVSDNKPRDKSQQDTDQSDMSPKKGKNHQNLKPSDNKERKEMKSTTSHCDSRGSHHTAPRVSSSPEKSVLSKTSSQKSSDKTKTRESKSVSVMESESMSSLDPSRSDPRTKSDPSKSKDSNRQDRVSPKPIVSDEIRSNGCKISTSSSGKSIVMSIPKHLLEKSCSDKDRKKKKKDTHHHHKHHRKHRRQSREERAKDHDRKSNLDLAEEAGKSEGTSSTSSSPNTDRGSVEEDPGKSSEYSPEALEAGLVKESSPSSERYKACNEERSLQPSTPQPGSETRDKVQSNESPSDMGKTSPPKIASQLREPVLQQLQDEMDKQKEQSLQSREVSDRTQEPKERVDNKSVKSLAKVNMDINTAVTPAVKPSSVPERVLKLTVSSPVGPDDGKETSTASNVSERTTTAPVVASVSTPEGSKVQSKSVSGRSEPAEVPKTTSASVSGTKLHVTTSGGDKKCPEALLLEKKKTSDGSPIMKIPNFPMSPIVPRDPNKSPPKKSILSKITAPRSSKLKPTLKSPMTSAPGFGHMRGIGTKMDVSSAASGYPHPRGIGPLKSDVPKAVNKMQPTSSPVKVDRQTQERPSTLQAPMPWKSLSTLAEAGKKFQESANNALGRNSPSKPTARPWFGEHEKSGLKLQRSVSAESGASLKPSTSYTEPFTGFGSPTLPKGMKTYSKKDKFTSKQDTGFSQLPASQNYEGAFKTFLANTDDGNSQTSKGSEANPPPRIKYAPKPKFERQTSSPQTGAPRHLHGHKVIGQLQMVYETMQKPSYPEVCRKSPKPPSPQKSALTRSGDKEGATTKPEIPLTAPVSEETVKPQIPTTGSVEGQTTAEPDIVITTPGPAELTTKSEFSTAAIPTQTSAKSDDMKGTIAGETTCTTENSMPTTCPGPLEAKSRTPLPGAVSGYPLTDSEKVGAGVHPATKEIELSSLPTAAVPQDNERQPSGSGADTAAQGMAKVTGDGDTHIREANDQTGGCNSSSVVQPNDRDMGSQGDCVIVCVPESDDKDMNRAGELEPPVTLTEVTVDSDSPDTSQADPGPKVVSDTGSEDVSPTQNLKNETHISVKFPEEVQKSEKCDSQSVPDSMSSRTGCDSSFSATHVTTTTSSHSNGPNICGAASPPQPVYISSIPSPVSRSPMHTNNGGTQHMRPHTSALEDPRNNSRSGCHMTCPGHSNTYHGSGGGSPQNNNLSAASSVDSRVHCDQCHSASTPTGNDVTIYEKMAPQEVPLNLHKPRVSADVAETDGNG